MSNARTAASVFANCMASAIPGTDAASDCQSVVDGYMVNGVFCDGNIILDANGKRCISAEQVQAKLAASQEPTGQAKLAALNANTPAGGFQSLPSWLPWAGALGLGLLLAVLVTRKG